MVVEKAKIIVKVSPAETIKSFSIGETRLIRQKDIGGASVRSTCSRLTKSGYGFYCKSHVDGVLVTRLK